MYRVMQVGSSGEVIELPQIVTRNFNTSNNQPSVISSNPLNSEFYKYLEFMKNDINYSHFIIRRTVLHRGAITGIARQRFPAEHSTEGQRRSQS